MSALDPALAAAALAALTDHERRHAVAYLDERLVEGGGTIAVDGEPITVQRPTAVAFVDREPGRNWGHAARYLLIDAASGEVASIDARMPPFLREVPGTLRLLHRGEAAPAWAVVTER